MSSAFDDFVDRTLRRVDEAGYSASGVPFKSYNQDVLPEDIDIRVTADGYVRSSSKWGKHMELILGFVQVCEAIEEEGKRNRGEQP